MPISDYDTGSLRRMWASVFAVVTLVILAGGLWFYQTETNAKRSQKYEELAAIGQLKVGQITRWREERLADARRTAGSPFLQRALEEWLRDPTNPQLTEDWRQRLQIEKQAHDYADVLLLAPDGSPLLAAEDSPDPTTAETQRAVEAAVASRDVVLSDFYRCTNHRIHIDAVAPIFDSTAHPLAILVLRDNADTYLYPLIQSWPTPSASGETLLIRRDGEDVLYLNTLRHRSGTALSLRIPLAQATLPAAMAILGTKGLVTGKDYRGVEVLADVQPIPDSSWFIVAKMDKAEVLADARERATFIATLVFALVLLAGAFTAFAYRQRQSRLYRVLYRSERAQRQAQEEFRATLYSIGDAVITTDETAQVRHMNHVAEQLTGWTEKDARGKPLEEVFRIVNEYSRDTVENPAQHVLREGRVIGLANHTLLIARDGTERPIADSGAPIRDDIGDITGVVLVFRDQTAERAAEQALRESKECYETIVNSVTDGIALQDASGEIRIWNNAAERIFAVSQSQAIGSTSTNRDWHVIGPDGAEIPGELHPSMQTLATGTPCRDTVLGVKRPDGTVAWVNINTAPLFKQDETKPYAVVISFADITERRRAEEELRRRESLLQKIFDILPVGLWFADKNGDIIRGNPKGIAIWGAEPCVGLPEYGVFKARRLPSRQEIAPEDWALAHAVRDGVTIVDELLEIDAFDGERRIILNYAAPVLDEQGAIEGAIVVNQDVTERMRAQEALRESQEQFRLAFENANIGMCLVDINGHIMRVNQQMCDMFGYSQPELECMTVSDISHPDYRDLSFEFIRQALTSDVDHDSFEKCYIHKSGDPVWGWVSSSLVRDAGGTPLYFVSHVQDITQRKQAEAERDQLQAQLLQAQKMEAVGRLAGGVAHDFNNMLSVILGHADLALQGLKPTEPFYEDLREIVKAGHRSADLTRQLLAFARKQTIAPRVLDLNETVSGMLNMLRRLIGEDIDLLWKPGRNLWPVMMDTVQLDQILANLTVNARDAISGGGKITIESANVEFDDAYVENHPDFLTGHYVMLAVSDDGCGMDKQTLANLFEPFFTTKAIGEGTGLGLATVYGIVKQNQGFINVYSEPGKGSTFKIYLSRHLDEVADPQPRKTAKPSNGTETVLVVEDEAALLRLTQRMLEQLGYTVLTAPGPKEAIEVAGQYNHEIHLLMTDVVMPEMSGRDIWKRLNAVRPQLKCLFMSGYTANVIAHHGVLDEGVHFLQKPFSADALAAKVREALTDSQTIDTPGT